MTLDLIGIVVTDMAKSLAFYHQLGLDIPEHAENEDHVEITLSNGLRLAWDTVEVIKSFKDWSKPSGHPMNLAFKFDNPAELNETYSKLVLMGYQGHREPFDAFWGQRYAIISDPDGNHIDLFAWL